MATEMIETVARALYAYDTIDPVWAAPVFSAMLTAAL